MDSTTQAALNAVSQTITPETPQAAQARVSAAGGLRGGYPEFTTQFARDCLQAVLIPLDRSATAAESASTSAAEIETALDGLEAKLDTMNGHLSGIRTDLQAINTTLGGIVAGTVALDGSNPTSVATGLSSISSVTLTIQGSAAPGLSTSVLTYTVSGGTLNIYAWKPTGALDPTLIASTGTETVAYVVRGAP